MQRAHSYGEEAEDLLTAMHEVIGHGSGKLSDRLSGGAEPYLKEYFSTLEEARADLMGLWNVWDPKLKELGLVKDQDSVAQAMYDNAARAPLTQLRRILKGNTIEEDHARDRALIANYIKDKTGAIEQVQRGGKTYVHIKDYQKMREGVGMLLSELMRIKAEGDYAAIKALVDKYGVRFDPGAARRGGRALQGTRPADLLGRREPRSDRAARREGRRDLGAHRLSARSGAPVSRLRQHTASDD